jgi:hypothetical protein
MVYLMTPMQRIKLVEKKLADGTKEKRLGENGCI